MKVSPTMSEAPGCSNAIRWEPLLIKCTFQMGTSVGADRDSNFARALGSSDWRTRDRAVTALTSWLGQHKAVGEADLQKIWKGLFYCFWHSDKEHVQVRCSSQVPCA